MSWLGFCLVLSDIATVIETFPFCHKFLYTSIQQLGTNLNAAPIFEAVGILFLMPDPSAVVSLWVYFICLILHSLMKIFCILGVTVCLKRLMSCQALWGAGSLIHRALVL